MRVDKPGDERVLGPIENRLRRKTLAHLGHWADADNLVSPHRERMLFEHQALRMHRNEPAGFD